MLTITGVERLEDQRVAAMLSADTATLSRLFHEDLRWVHASGGMDTKQAMLAQFADGSMRCFTIDRTDVLVRVFGDTGVVLGTVMMDAQVGGTRKSVVSRICGVWVVGADGAQLVSWQSARAS